MLSACSDFLAFVSNCSAVTVVCVDSLHYPIDETDWVLMNTSDSGTTHQSATVDFWMLSTRSGLVGRSMERVSSWRQFGTLWPAVETDNAAHHKLSEAIQPPILACFLSVEVINVVLIECMCCTGE